MADDRTSDNDRDTMAVDDRDLVAYVDGELTGHARDRVAGAIAADAGVARRAERFLAARDAAAGALAGVLAAPVPSQLRQAVLAGPRAGASWHRRLDDLTKSWGWRLGAPIGALAVGAIVAAIVILGPVQPFGNSAAPYLPAGGETAAAMPPEAQAALMDLLAGDTAEPNPIVGDGWSIALVGGPVDQSGCRAFVLHLNGASEAGLACRSGAGGWSVTTMPAGDTAGDS